MRNLLMLPFIFVFSHGLIAQKSNFDFEEKFSADSLKSWTIQLMDEIAEGHPGFYRYTPKDRFDDLIDSTLQTINDSLTTLAYYRKIKPLYAKIACLHTSIFLSDPFMEHIDQHFKLLPIEVYIDQERRVFITKNHSTTKDLPLKSEVISIDGFPIQDILNQLYQAIPADGYNQTLKRELLNYNFAIWYQTVVRLANEYSIELKSSAGTQSFEVEGVNRAVFPTYQEVEKVNEPQLDFHIDHQIGYLTIHSFAKTVIKKNGQNFKKFIKQTFATLQEKDIPYLVIDLRNNSGGTDGNAAFLTRHFFDQPFRYWEQIEVTEHIAKQIKGFARLFYHKPHLIDGSYHWVGSNMTKEFDYYKVQQPAKNNYKGQVYIITNGLCMSSCADVAAILSYNDKAKIVGQESGGGFQGNTSGLMPTDESFANLMIVTPLQKYVNFVDKSKNVGRGTIPDYPIMPSLEAWMNGEEVELELVKQLIDIELSGAR